MNSGGTVMPEEQISDLRILPAHHSTPPATRSTLANNNSSKVQVTTDHDEAVLLSTPTPAHSISISTTATSNIDLQRFLLAAFSLCTLRTIVQHPLILASTLKMAPGCAADAKSFDLLRGLMSQGRGPRELTRGLASSILGVSGCEVVFLGSYEQLRSTQLAKDCAVGESVSSFTGDVLSRSVLTPFAVITTRQMLAVATSSSSPAMPWWKVGSSLYQQHGTPALYRGILSSFAFGSTLTAFWWQSYVGLKGVMYSALDAPTTPNWVRTSVGLSKERSSRHSADGASSSPKTGAALEEEAKSTIVNSVASVTSSAVASFVFNPCFVIRSRQMALNLPFRHALRHVVNDTGIRGLWAGMTINLTSCIVDGLLTSTSYEYAKHFATMT